MFYGLHTQRIRTLSTLQNAHSEGREASAPLGLLHCVTRPPGRVLARSNLSDETPFLGFHHRGTDYWFRALPFGIDITPRIFTKLITAAVRLISEQGIFILAYLDDLLVAAPSASLCAAHLMITLEILSNLGWVVNLR